MCSQEYACQALPPPPPPLLVKVHRFCLPAVLPAAGRAGMAPPAARWAVQPQSRSCGESRFSLIYRCFPAVNAQLPSCSRGGESTPLARAQASWQGPPSTQSSRRQRVPPPRGCLLQPATCRGFATGGKALSVVVGGTGCDGCRPRATRGAAPRARRCSRDAVQKVPGLAGPAQPDPNTCWRWGREKVVSRSSGFP